MTNVQVVQQHPASVDAYIRHGWSLVPIPGGTKGPRTIGWNTKEASLRSQNDLPQGYGIGLAHAYSGTMALDIDDWETAERLLNEQGVDLTTLYNDQDAVIIDSGRPGRGKLLYAMPFGLVLPSKKILQGKKTAYELRCATVTGLTSQDVLPPSIHPDTGRPYQWAGRGHWTRLPAIPASLLSIWQELVNCEKERVIDVGTPIAVSWQEIQHAMHHVPPDCSRDEWINVGMALNWAGSQNNGLEQAFHLWNDWSSQSASKYPGEHAIYRQWCSFKPDKLNSIKLGTLFQIAKKYGWVRAPIDASDLFKDTRVISEDPTDVIQSLRARAPSMDMSLFPKVLTRRAQEVSDSVGCDPLVPLWAGLSVICGVIDARIRLELMPGFTVPPILWMMTIGDPADKKSPGSWPMFKPLSGIEAEDRPRYHKELLDWEGKEAAYSSAKKAFLEFCASSEGAMDMSGAPLVQEQPKQPVSLKITVSDITSQKLVRSAADRPRGLLCHLDEMNSWIRKLTDKKSGEDRSAWVMSYESKPYEMDRVGAGSIHCENLAVGIYGNIQPRVFRENMYLLADDGLLQRFIPAILRASQTRLGNPIPDFLTNEVEWENTLRMVFALPVQTYKLSKEAYTKYREFQAWYEQAKQDERLIQSHHIFMTAFGKIEGTVGRIALLFHVLENPFDLNVSSNIIERAILLVKTYIIPALRYAFNEIGDASSIDTWLADFIIQRSDKSSITLSDIKNASRKHAEGMNVWQHDQMIFCAMMTLEKLDWVMRTDDKSRESQHIAEWAINPSLYANQVAYRERLALAKQRVLDTIHQGSPPPLTH